MQTLVSLLFLPLVPLVMALTAPGLLGGLLIEKANEAVLKGRRQAGRRGKLLIVAGTLGRVGGSLCKLAVPTALVFLGFFLMGPTGGLLALCVVQQLFLGDLTSLFKGDFFRQDTFGASDDALFSAKEGEEINTTLLLKLRKGAWEGNGVPGLHSVQYTGLKGITHKRPGLKIEVDHGADIDALTASIIQANPEFAHYTFVDQYQGMDFFPSWFTLLKPRSVAVFRLDTTPE